MANAARLAARIRVARPTDRLSAVVRFYTEGLGLEEIGRFEGHAGYDGVMVGLPGAEHHLEFTSYVEGSPSPAPSRDNLLVFYLADEQARNEIATRLRALGAGPVAAENPHWTEAGALTFEDPDGWRVVLAPRAR
jgi:catechol 2,3-dioxygenase-like lactoylglutathione lyase family enzyme